MKHLPMHRPAGPPHNPGVREIVSAKRRWSSPPNRDQEARGFRGWHERGYLPHRDQPGLTQFVTFHLADSFPTALRSEWLTLLRLENDRERYKQLASYLDKGNGACHLRKTEVGDLVDRAIRFYHKRNFDLHAWVVMPNHVHALFTVIEKPLSRIVSELKEYTARQANKVLRRSGAFWAEDYWDTYMRDSDHERKTRRYIDNNPVKAGLVHAPEDWLWSSARYRDNFGKLTI